MSNEIMQENIPFVECSAFHRGMSVLEASLRNTEDSEAIISGLLKGAAEFYGASRASVVEADWDLGIGVITYEWCKDGVPAQRDMLQCLPMEKFPRWRKALRANKPVVISDLQRLEKVYTDIDLKHTSAEGAKLLREYLDYAENGSVALERAISVSPFEQFDSDFELEVCDYLRSKGFAVDTQVGCSGFRIDLGLKLPDSSDYVLAIECDGATYHSSKNARDRDRLRQEILERMGWKFYRIWSTDWFRNKSVEQLRLLEAAADAVKNPTKAEAKPVDSQPAETFEEVAVEKHFEFPAYKAADFFEVCRRHHHSDFKAIVKEILEVESPLSEDLFLKRIVWYFDREKVTSVVQRAYEQQMYGCQRYGIIRRNGFLYLDNGKEVQFRGPGDVERDIKQIAPEELAAGMFEILKQNVTADKSGLYRSLAAQCGVTRVGKAINEAMDAALNVLSDRIIIDGEQVSIK